MEKTITMPLTEYDELVGENERMKSILNAEKNMIGIEVASTHLGMGLVLNSWNIIAKDELIRELALMIKHANEDARKARTELFELENKRSQERDRNAWCFFSKR